MSLQDRGGQAGHASIDLAQLNLHEGPPQCI